MNEYTLLGIARCGEMIAMPVIHLMMIYRQIVLSFIKAFHRVDKNKIKKLLKVLQQRILSAFAHTLQHEDEIERILKDKMPG